jgi:hypothetical protein
MRAWLPQPGAEAEVDDLVIILDKSHDAYISNSGASKLILDASRADVVDAR